jgi:hypothetical protein
MLDIPHSVPASDPLSPASMQALTFMSAEPTLFVLILGCDNWVRVAPYLLKVGAVVGALAGRLLRRVHLLQRRVEL